MSGKRITLTDLFKRKEQELRDEYAQRQAYEATPEGRAEKLERDAFHRRMKEADERFAVENPTDHFAEGKCAALSGGRREIPDDLSDDDAEQWLLGWDSEGSSDE